MRTYRLGNANETLVLAAKGEELASVIYWGPALHDDEDLESLLAASELDVAGGQLDANPELSICPLASRSFPGQPALIARSASGALLRPKLLFREAQQEPGSLLLKYGDKDLGLSYTARFRAEQSLMVAHSEIESEEPIILEWLAAPVFPALQSSREFLEFSGRWCGEFQMARQPWSPGARLRNNRTGRTGHEHFPGLIVTSAGCSRTQGQAQAFHYGWSGGHQMIAEELSDGRRQVQFGNAPGSELSAGRSFETAPLYLSHSERGLNGCAVAMQRHVRDNIVSWPSPLRQRPRPVHYNCWEAIYFKHSIEELKKIASLAASIGAERFVLDDGWFKDRTSDLLALGDWVVDPKKYPDGLGPLIDHVRAEGMGFGIWFEPEMVNTDSDLYRQHPGWLLGDLDQIPGRQQYCLDMSLPEVRTYLHDHIAAILREYEVEYIKWDHNRVLPFPDANQVRGTYELLDRLRGEFPHVEIESCSSGGGRIDYGILRRTQRVWLSDSNDAIERMRIQHNASLWLPSVVTGSHVGPRTSHTSGRTIDITTRAWVAAQRHMGFEMDPRELDPRELEVLKRVTSWWKENRAWLSEADILSLDSEDAAVVAEQHLARDGSRFVVFAGKQDTSAQVLPRPLRLAGLSAGARYRLRLLNSSEAHELSRGRQSMKEGRALELSGRFLTSQGLGLPWSFPERVWVLEGTLLS